MIEMPAPINWAKATKVERFAYCDQRSRAERVAQGLPEEIEDPEILERLAILLEAGRVAS